MALNGLEKALNETLDENQLLKEHILTITTHKDIEIVLETKEAEETLTNSEKFKFSMYCQECGKGFNHKKNMADHMQSHKTKLTPEFKCSS